MSKTNHSRQKRQDRKGRTSNLFIAILCK